MRPPFRKSILGYVTLIAVLVIATSGTTAYAATKITSKQIKNGTIRLVDMHANSVNGSKVVNGSLSTADLAASSRSAAYSRFHDAGVSIQNQVLGVDRTVISLTVPAGSYVFSATTWLENNSGSVNVLPRCKLTAGADVDTKLVLLEPVGQGSHAQAVALQVVHTFAAPGIVRLTCYSFGVTVLAHDTKLTGIRVASLTNSAG